MKDLSIYVHIPFCASKCFYCTFSSSVRNEIDQKNYFNALENEIASRSKTKKNYLVKSIYFGGGTPSFVDENEIERILGIIEKCFEVSKEAEITIELNPSSTTLQKLKKYKQIGINRLSFGVQSFNKKSLLFVGRLQSENEAKLYKEKVFECLKMAKEVGFNNISCDFILGLPFQKTSEIRGFLNQLVPYVTHLSCYMLQLESGTKLESLMNGKVDEEKIALQYEIASKFLDKLGFVRYEISNFALPGFESKHNKVYWQRKEYLGFGQSASSFVGKTRLTNTSSFENYLEFWSKKRLVSLPILKEVCIVENLTQEQEIEEEIMLSLRTKEGLDLNNFKKRFFDLICEKRSKINVLTNLNFVEIKDCFLKLTNSGILLENEIVCQLCS